MIVRFGQILLAWLAGSATAYALASVAHTQTILAALGDLGVRIAPGERLATSIGDLAGLWRYGLVIAIGLALGLFALRAPPRRLVPLPPAARDALAGALAVACTLLAMRLAFSITPIASARGVGGFALQCASGGAGGLVFFACLKRTEAARTDAARTDAA